MSFSIVKRAFAVAMLAVSSSVVMAIPYTDVGSVDTFIASAKLANSGDGTVESWVESVLGDVDLTFSGDDKIDGYASWQAVSGDPAGTDLWALEFDEAYDYFIVKTGNLKVTDHTTFLYRNLGEMLYGVIDLKNFGADFEIKLGKISHTNPYSAPASVPEPGSLGLLMAGALGLVAARRLARKA